MTNSLGSPVEDLAQAIGHATHVGFSDIVYQSPDYTDPTHFKKMRQEGTMKMVEKRRRPMAYNDFEVYAMFAQVWGSTALGHGGVGGASMTTAYTIVLHCRATGEFLVYFGGMPAYKVRYEKPSEYEKFSVDISNRNVLSKREAMAAHGATELPWSG